MPPLESAPVTGWDDLPHSGDKSIGADLARFKWYRNKLAHHEDGKLSHTEYNQYWGDLEGVSLQILITLKIITSNKNFIGKHLSEINAYL